MIETIIGNFHLEKIIWIVKKNLAIIIILAALGGIAGGSFAVLTNEVNYTAAISFYVYSNPDYVYESSVNISNTEFTLAKNLVQSYIMVLKSDTVMEKVIEETELPYTAKQLSSSIGHSVVSGTAIFYVYVYNENPYNAMEIANAIAEIAPTEIARIVKSGGVEVVDYASLPTNAHSSNNIIKYVILGFAGLGGLTAVIFLFLGLLDTTIRRKYELRLAFQIPMLGDVPIIASVDKDSQNKLLKEESPFALKESYNIIRANMLFTGKGEKCPVYVITSAEQGEGKTLNTVNLAISYAQMQKKVLLIDADMRNASIHKRLGIEEKTGLSQYLAGLSKEKYVEVMDNLFVMTAGATPPNPAELLMSEKMTELLEHAKKEFDCIFIDMPPVGIVSEAMTLADKATGYILVVRAGLSKMSKEKSAIQLLEHVNANICGIIFNGMNPKSQDYAYRKYGYEYQYGSNDENDTKKKDKKKG